MEKLKVYISNYINGMAQDDLVDASVHGGRQLMRYGSIIHATRPINNKIF